MAGGAGPARVLIAAAIGALAGALSIAEAQTGRTAAQAERDRRAEAGRAQRLREQSQRLAGEVGALSGRLAEAGQRRAVAAAAEAEASARLEQIHTGIQADARHQATARASLEAALIAAAFAERELAPAASRAGLAAAAAAQVFIAAERAAARSRQHRLGAAAALELERAVLADAHAAIDAERADLVSLLERRRAERARSGQAAERAERRAAAFAAEARTLQELAARVERSPARAGPSNAGGPPASWLAPAGGRIVRTYGERQGAGPAAQGTTLRTEASALVSAPASGEIAYAGPFRSFGQVLILELDGGYALVLTGLAEIDVAVGQRVRAGQRLGAMAASVMPPPELYVEVRRNGHTVDPGRWLSARGLSAEGNRAGRG